MVSIMVTASRGHRRRRAAAVSRAVALKRRLAVGWCRLSLTLVGPDEEVVEQGAVVLHGLP
jgi:hypothetical protein